MSPRPADDLADRLRSYGDLADRLRACGAPPGTSAHGYERLRELPA